MSDQIELSLGGGVGVSCGRAKMMRLAVWNGNADSNVLLTSDEVTKLAEMIAAWLPPLPRPEAAPATDERPRDIDRELTENHHGPAPTAPVSATAHIAGRVEKIRRALDAAPAPAASPTPPTGDARPRGPFCTDWRCRNLSPCGCADEPGVVIDKYGIKTRPAPPAATANTKCPVCAGSGVELDLGPMGDPSPPCRACTPLAPSDGATDSGEK